MWSARLFDTSVIATRWMHRAYWEMAGNRVRYGYRRLKCMLIREGWNEKAGVSTGFASRKADRAEFTSKASDY